MRSRSRKKSKRSRSKSKSGNIDKIILQKSSNPDKKYMVTIGNKTVHFGASAYQSYEVHKDPERKKRYEKRHKSQEVIEWCVTNKAQICYKGLTEPPKAMPDEYKVKDVVESYRNYYRGAKSGFAVWKNRQVPEWYMSL